MIDERTQQLLNYVAANVRKLRREQGLTQQALAERGGLDLIYVQRIERAAINATVSRLVRLADALRVDPGSLMSPAKQQVRTRGRPPVEPLNHRKK